MDKEEKQKEINEFACITTRKLKGDVLSFFLIEYPRDEHGNIIHTDGKKAIAGPLYIGKSNGKDTPDNKPMTFPRAKRLLERYRSGAYAPRSVLKAREKTKSTEAPPDNRLTVDQLFRRHVNNHVTGLCDIDKPLSECKEFIRTFLKSNREQEKSVTRSSILDTINNYFQYVYETFGDRYLETIDRTEVEDWLNKLKARGKWDRKKQEYCKDESLSASTLKHAGGILFMISAYANEIDKPILRFNSKGLLPKKSELPVVARSMPLDDVKNLINLVNNWDDKRDGLIGWQARMIVLFAIVSGNRFGEIVSIKKTYIESDRIKFPLTKSGKEHFISISLPLRKIIDYILSEYPSSSPYLFPSPVDDSKNYSSHLSEKWHKIRAKAGLADGKYKDGFQFKDLRSVQGGLYLGAGGTLTAMSKHIKHHGDTKVTEAHYAGLDFEDAKLEINTVVEKLFGDVINFEHKPTPDNTLPIRKTAGKPNV